ncbi:FAD/NAD(P)-binding oxidoreductase [Serratia sp. DD3]|uniref:NAD(P)/FAD-dependent oxidoreductase n=1 Tax=Serratia sp. DD3 TaxID=1410619 RepID=UPI0003C50CC6|nr:FAD/NAD(P)-binding oxidoreductase [Serratia sp. DD3]KEY58629.1 hydrogen cyanide synthase subunit HcnB [Serratia sp. DD3]
MMSSACTLKNWHCDILIIGAGPAGMAAANAAATKQTPILIIDDNPRPGGQIWRDGPVMPIAAKAKRHIEMIKKNQNITLLSNTKIVGSNGPQRLIYESSDQYGTISYQRLILCTGAREQLLPFPGWTLPGVTGAGGLQAMVKNGLPLQRQRVMIAGSGPLLLAVANSVQRVGGQVVGIAEQAKWPALLAFSCQLWRWPSKGWQALRLFQRHYRPDSMVLEALGEQRLEAVRIRLGQREKTVSCDRLACGFGLVPNSELAQLLGCHLNAQKITVDQWQQSSQPTIYAAGECTGIGGSELALVEGTIAGYAAIEHYSQAATLFHLRHRWLQFADHVATAFTLNQAVKQLATPETLLCRCEDVPLSMLTPHDNWQQAKLHSRCGMGACQGKICATAAHTLLGWAPPAPRVPLSPVRIGTLVGTLSSKTQHCP